MKVIEKQLSKKLRRSRITTKNVNKLRHTKLSCDNLRFNGLQINGDTNSFHTRNEANPFTLILPYLTVETLAIKLRRSEEHTSELQSPDHLVCRLLLEKKKNDERKHANA